MPGDDCYQWLVSETGDSNSLRVSSFADPGGVKRSLTAFKRVQKSPFSLSEEKITSRVNLVIFADVILFEE